MHGRDAVPVAVPQKLQPGDVFVGEEQRQDADVAVRPDAEHELRSRAGRVVVEPGVRGGALVAELAEDAAVVVVVELQKPCHDPEDPVLDSLAALSVLVQKTPAFSVVNQKNSGFRESAVSEILPCQYCRND